MRFRPAAFSSLGLLLVFVKCTKKNHSVVLLGSCSIVSGVFFLFGEKYKPCKCKTSRYCIKSVHFEVCALLVQL